MFFDQLKWARRRWAAGLALACLVGIGISIAVGGRGLAQPASGKATRGKNDPGARALLEQVSKAYRGLTSYSDQGQFVVDMKLGDKVNKRSQPLNLSFARPNKVNLNAGAVHLNSDGKTLTTVVDPFKKYTQVPAPAAIGFDTFREGPVGAVLFGGPTAAPMYVLLNLLTGTNPDVLVDQIGGTIRPAPATEGGKADNSALLVDLAEGPDLMIRIDPATKLLSAIDLNIDPKRLADSAPPGQTISIQHFGWTAGSVSTQAAKDGSFAFVAPKGFALVESFKAEPGAGQGHQYAVQEWIGKPAPDFSLTLLDGAGKTKTVTKAELAGKVVLIDFWATWCGPCLMEIPEIQKLIESYANSKKDIVIVALSQDDNPAEISEVRKLVEKTLESKKITLPAPPVGWIGLDPSNSVSKALDVEGFPTLVIIDGKGIIQSAHVGFNPEAAEPLHKSLAKEIDALLQGKSLAPPAGGAEKKPGR
jgi:thiol-disulfide isomerase/thioredoxin